MGLVVKETPLFLIQKTKKGWKLFGKVPGLTPKYGAVVSDAWFSAFSDAHDEAFDLAALAEIGGPLPLAAN